MYSISSRSFNHTINSSNKRISSGFILFDLTAESNSVTKFLGLYDRCHSTGSELDSEILRSTLPSPFILWISFMRLSRRAWILEPAIHQLFLIHLSTTCCHEEFPKQRIKKKCKIIFMLSKIWIWEKKKTRNWLPTNRKACVWFHYVAKKKPLLYPLYY